MAIRGSDFSEADMMGRSRTDNGAAGSGALVAAPYPAPVPAMAGHGQRGPEIIHGGFNSTWLAHCLRRRWLMAALLGLLFGALTAGLLMWAFPEAAQVTAYLKVKSGSNENIFQDARQRLPPQELEKQAMNHLSLLRAPMVLEAALQKREVAELDAVRAHKGEELLWLKEELRVSFPGDGEILEVRYEGHEDPEQMVTIVNAVVKAYQDKVLLSDRVAREATQTDLATVLGTIKSQLGKLLEDYKSKANKQGLFTEEIKIPKIRNEIQMLESQRMAAQKEIVDLEVLKALSLQSAQDQSVIEAMVQQEMDKDPMINNYKQQIFQVQQALDQQRASSRNKNNPRSRLLESQLQQLDAQLTNYRREASKAARDRFRNMPNESLRSAMQEYQIRYAAAEENVKKYTEQIEELNDELLTMGVRDPELELLERDIESERAIANALELKVREANVQAQAQELRDRLGQTSEFEKVTVIQEATAIPATNRIERYSIAGIGGLAALALTCYTIALLEFRHRRLNGPNDVDEGLGMRVLGVLPPASLKTLAGSSLVATQVAEAIDNVRATLMHDSTSRSSQVVMVASAGSQEGSTVVASSLALSFSRAGRRTLLVDGDLRAADLHKLFGMPLEGGLSEVLRAEIDLDDAVRPTNNDKLYLLSAGVCDADAIHALATEQPHVIFDKLREQFDFIVIDAPPILGISDSLSLGQYADGAVLTVLRDHSEIRQVYQAAEMLKRMGIRLLGSVVNGVPFKVDRRVVRLHQATAKQQLRLAAKSED